MKNFDLSDDEYIVKNSAYGTLNGVGGEFTITNENIIFTSEKGIVKKTDIVKKIPFSSIKNPKGHLQALFNGNEERIDLYCNDGQYEIEFDDFDYKKFISLLQENINGVPNSENASEDEDKLSNLSNIKKIDNTNVDATVKNFKRGFETFAGIAKNMAKVSTNYIKDASEKYLQNSQNVSVNNQVTSADSFTEQVEDIDELKKKLVKLKEMFDEGLLTHDEYEEKRNLIIGKQKKSESPIEKVLDIAKGKPKVKKCPSCGELLGTFDIKCPSCGYEIRNIEKSSAMVEFQDGLNGIEKMRNQANEINVLGVRMKLNRENEDIEITKAEYIRNYIVPRTKEDLIEFMLLAKSNVNTKLYAQKYKTINPDEYEQKKNLSDAWFSMMRQIFDKARVIFDDEDKTYKKIEKMYVETYNQIM